MTTSKPINYELPPTAMTVLATLLAHPGATINRYPNPGDHPLIVGVGLEPGKPSCPDSALYTLRERGLVELVPGTSYPARYAITERAKHALALAELLAMQAVTSAQARILAQLAEPQAVLHWDTVGSCQRNIWGVREGRNALIRAGVPRIACLALRERGMIHCTLRDVCQHWNLSEMGRRIADAVLALDALDQAA